MTYTLQANAAKKLTQAVLLYLDTQKEITSAVPMINIGQPVTTAAADMSRTVLIYDGSENQKKGIQLSLVETLSSPIPQKGHNWCKAISTPMGRYHNPRDAHYHDPHMLKTLTAEIRGYYVTRVLDELIDPPKKTGTMKRAWLLMAHQVLSVAQDESAPQENAHPRIKDSLTKVRDTLTKYIDAIPLLDEKKRLRYKLPALT